MRIDVDGLLAARSNEDEPVPLGDRQLPQAEIGGGEAFEALAAWLADTSAPAPEGLSVAGFGAVIGDPAAAEAAVEAPATDFNADLGDATAS